MNNPRGFPGKWNKTYLCLKNATGALSSSVGLLCLVSKSDWIENMEAIHVIHPRPCFSSLCGEYGRVDFEGSAGNSVTTNSVLVS